MNDTREKRAKLNIVISLCGQIVKLLCGLVIPGVMINSFGSEIYGATSSIAQLLAYITLLEGGVGGVARAVLYKPLAEKDEDTINAIVSEMKDFFRVIAYVFVGYVIVIACSFKQISHFAGMDWLSTFLLVGVISISTLSQYFIGISYSVLLQAAQKTYVRQAAEMVTTVLNTMCILALTSAGRNIIEVKLMSSCVFAIQPVVLWLYAKKHYVLTGKKKSQKTFLKQKWAGMSQHIAFFLHSNTDVAVLTVFSDLTLVAVYSVYNMIVAHVQNLTSSFTSGMEALFGDMLARNEHDKLHKTFGYYDTLISVVTIILLATTAVLIVPFIKLYTIGVQDANYVEPVFAIMLVLSATVYCLRMPYHAMIIAAGHFRQTQTAAYSEVIINLGISIVLVREMNLVGVAIGTLVATAFRMVYYAVYLSKQIFQRPIKLFVKREIVNFFAFAGSFFGGTFIISFFDISDYFQWVISGIVVGGTIGVFVIVANWLVYRNDITLFIKTIFKKKK